MKKIVFGLLVFGLTSQFMFSQIIELPEVLVSVNYKYLNAINSEETAVPVKQLEEKVALYNLKESDIYSDEYDNYTVSFYIPNGKIVAAYDKDGKIIRTIEKFDNIQLSQTVRNSIAKRFPNWAMVKDVYKVNYYTNDGFTNKQYKVKLKNGDKSMTIKVDDNGDFL